jgi:hypothetical protein
VLLSGPWSHHGLWITWILYTSKATQRKLSPSDWCRVKVSACIRKIFRGNLVLMIVYLELLMFSSAPSAIFRKSTSNRPGPPCYRYFQFTIRPAVRHFKTSSHVHDSYAVIPLCICSIAEHSTRYFARILPFDAVLCELRDSFLNVTQDKSISYSYRIIDWYSP